MTDASNCGFCGHNCLGATCSAGVCAPVTLANVSAPLTIAVDATHVFFGSADGVLRRVPIGGAAAETLAFNQVASVGSNRPDDLPLTIDATNLYWASLDGKIRQVPKAGAATPTDITSFTLAGFERPTGIAVSGSTLYVAISSPLSATGYISQVTLPGGAQSPLAPTQEDTRQVVTDGSEVFWAAISDFLSTRPAIRKVSVAGGTVADLYLQGAYMFTTRSGIAIDGASVYWADLHSVLKAPKVGGAPTTIINRGSTICCQWVAVNGGSVYWTDNGGTSIATRPADGSSTPLLLATGQTNITGLAVDGTHVYWLDDQGSGTGALRKTPR